jgi:hypothetical protein
MGSRLFELPTRLIRAEIQESDFGFWRNAERVEDRMLIMAFRLSPQQTVSQALSESRPWNRFRDHGFGEQEKGKVLSTKGSRQRIQTSTRRFFSRPSSVSFEAIGITLPNPLTTDGLMPRICN